MTSTTTIRSLATAALAAAAFGLAACGGDTETPAGASSGDGEADAGDRREMFLEYAKCMRDQGIDFPDPEPGEGGLLFKADESLDPEKLRAAEEECGELLEEIEPPELSDEQQQEFKDAALAHARCMREHGIDMPDPTFGADGRVTQRLEGGVDPEDPRFREAQEACEDTLPDRERILGGEQP